MPILETLPASFLPTALHFRPSVPAVLGPQPFANAPQAVVSDAGHWKASYDQIFLRGAGLLEFRTFAARIEGLAGAYNVPAHDCPLTPRALAGIARGGPVQWSGDLDWSSGSGDPQAGDAAWTGSAPDFAIVGYAAAGATVIRLRPLTTGLALRAGHYLSLDTLTGRRLHVVRRMTHVAASPGQYDCSIWPRLRHAVRHTTPVDTESPSCPMALAQEEPSLTSQLGRYGYAALEWREVPW